MDLELSEEDIDAYNRVQYMNEIEGKVHDLANAEYQRGYEKGRAEAALAPPPAAPTEAVVWVDAWTDGALAAAARGHALTTEQTCAIRALLPRLRVAPEVGHG
jgi:hypothetical protein